MNHLHLPENTEGRDFVVGDIQGCFTHLMRALELLKFDFTKDRLLPVGDLIDRGPESFECANLIYEPWCFSTKGNHEQFLIQAINHSNTNYYNIWIHNGGLWHKEIDIQLLQDIADKFDELPYIISVGSNSNRYNIVHAELTLYSPDLSRKVTNDHIDHWNFQPLEIHDMTWGRQIISTRQDKSNALTHIGPEPQFLFHDQFNLSPTFVGHSAAKKPMQIEQHIYIDTGVCFNKMMTLACPTEQTIYQYNPIWRKITSFPLSQIHKYN